MRRQSKRSFRVWEKKPLPPLMNEVFGEGNFRNENDFKEDKEFIIRELERWSPHIVYVNGQSVLTPKLGKHQVEI